MIFTSKGSGRLKNKIRRPNNFHHASKRILWYNNPIMVTEIYDSHIHLMLTTYIFTMLFCVFTLCYLAIKSGKTPLRAAFMITQTVIIVWLFFALLEAVSIRLPDILFNMKVSLICVNFIAPLWLITMLFYTDRLSRKNYWIIPAILAIPTAICVPLFTNIPWIFELYIKDIKEIYVDDILEAINVTWGSIPSVGHAAALLFLLLISYTLFDFFKEKVSIKAIEKTVLLVVIWSPIATHYLWWYHYTPFDFTPIVFSLLGVITVYLSSRRQFFNAVPSLVWNIFNIAKESMIVLGTDGSINVNKTFTDAFGLGDSDFLDFADTLSPGLRERIQEKQDITGLEAEKDGVYYEISIKNVRKKGDRIVGQLITINDVSETKQLTLGKERARIAVGLHDSMGNRLIVTINNLSLALSQPTFEKSKVFLENAATSTAASLLTLRKIVEGLSPVDFGNTKLIPLISSVINRVEASGLNTDLKVIGEVENLPVAVKGFIYSTCQEALTNSIIHGKAENVIIKLERDDNKLNFIVVDDGQGCKSIQKNNGLRRMESRAKELGGKIRFGSPSVGGFGIYAELPITMIATPI